MLSFFKKAKKTGKDTAVSPEQLFGQEEATTHNQNAKLVLYFHPSWGEIGQEQKYIYQFLHKELPSLQENQISLARIGVEKQDETYHVSAFIRSSVPTPVKLENTTLLLLNKDGQICARKTFDLSKLGDIPAKVNMPYVFTFEKDTMTDTALSNTDWQLAFEMKSKHQLDLDPTWETQLSEENKQQLREFVANLTPPAEGEISFLGFQAQKQENGDLHTTILLRNGCNRNIQLEQLPLHISDASGDVVAQGSFMLTNFEMKANTTKPWTFIFPSSLVMKEAIDLSTWKAFVPQS